MVWNIGAPADTDPIRQGANEIRTFKSDLQNALQAEGVFPGANLSSPVYRWKPRQGSTGQRPANDNVNPGTVYFNTDTTSIQVDNGTSWIDATAPVPPGTVMVFFQAAAPGGWTQVVSQNDSALRVVNTAGGGTGGSNPVSAGLSHTHVLSGNTDIATLENRQVVVSGGGQTGQKFMDDFGDATKNKAVDDHYHTYGSTIVGTAAPVIQYINVIICSKN